MSTWETYLQTHQERYLRELTEFLRIPSIAALPDHAEDVQHAAEWVAQRLTAAGMEHAQVLPTDGHPVVYADWLHAPGKPTVLIYGHFDVQPVDPVELWEHPPFEPYITAERISARGASDNKGNLFIPIVAAEALLSSDGMLPVNVKFFAEGQEEIGSPDLEPFVAANRELLACDYILNADMGNWSEDQPALTLGLRGLCALQVNVLGPVHDLHSGSYGGIVHNPIHALVRLLAGMRDDEGRVLVEGFYDDVPLPDAQTRADVAAIPYDAAAEQKELGVPAFFGEAGYTPLERTWLRPTLEINGIWGGFQGQGSKTVIPSSAHAKITCRLVPHQDPRKIAALVKRHAESHCPPGVRVQVAISAEGAWPYGMAREHPGNQAADAVLTEVYGVAPYYARAGGTIAVLSMFERYLGVKSVSFGFGLEDELIHAPNEFFRLKSFRLGQQAYAKMLLRLGA